MKHSTILVPIKCSPETNPKVAGYYFTDKGKNWFDKEWKYKRRGTKVNCSIWYKNEHDKIVLSEEEAYFKMPDDTDLIKIAILFNEGKIEEEKLGDMVGMCQFVLDRLLENNDVKKQSSKEKDK